MSIQQAFNATLASGATAMTALRFAYQHSPQYEAAANEYKAKQLEKRATKYQTAAENKLAEATSYLESDVRERPGTIEHAQSEAAEAGARKSAEEFKSLADRATREAYSTSPTYERGERLAKIHGDKAQAAAFQSWVDSKIAAENQALRRMGASQEQQRSQRESLEFRKDFLKGTSTEVKEWRDSFKKEGESK